jgi:hypothetical protein
VLDQLVALKDKHRDWSVALVIDAAKKQSDRAATLEQPAPVRIEHAPRGRPVWEKVGPRLEALLAEPPRWTGGKQRLTATRLHAMLVTEGYEVGITTV